MNEIGDYVYHDKDLIGRGSFARVYKGKLKSNLNSNNGKEVALKVMELMPSQSNSKHLLREIDLMKRLNHDNIVRLYDVYQEGNSIGGHVIYIVMELCVRDLSHVEKPLEEARCQRYFSGIFNGLRYLKRRGVVHRDIKPQNILITHTDEVRIADFTFSKEIEEQELLETYCGTPLFMSPEVLNGQNYTDRCDLYSVGTMLYMYVYGHHPLGNIKTQAELLSRMRNPSISFPQRLVWEAPEKSAEDGPYAGATVLCRFVREFTPDLIVLMKGLLRQDPEDRLTWDQINDDKWLKLPEWHDEDLFQRTQNSSVGKEEKETHSSSAPIPAPPIMAPPLVPRALKAPKMTKAPLPMKRMVTSPDLFIGSAAAAALSAENNHSSSATLVGQYDKDKDRETVTYVKTARSKPRKIPTKTKIQKPKSESPSPATSSLERLPFQMSGEGNSSPDEQTLIIEDYYNTPPSSVPETKRKVVIPASQEKERPNQEKHNQQMSESQTNNHSLVSRSLDLLHRLL
jgi:serine/threonine protein kinase